MEDEQMQEQQTHPEPVPTSSSTVSRVLIFALAAALGLTAVFGFHERNAAQQAADRSAQVQASLAATNAQIQQLTAKLNDLTAPKAAPVEEPAVRPAVRHKAVVRHVRRDDPRFKKMQEQLDAQNKAIEDTRSDLAGTRTDLQGSIARTHDELVALQRKGERNYYEFDIYKSKQFNSTGPVGVRLRKANVKHQYADLELLVDDVSLTKKHVNLYEPAVFYSADSEHPVELVINSVTKNHIHGYVSAPKYRRSELSAMGQTPSNPQATNTDAASTPPQPRQRLTLPH